MEGGLLLPIILTLCIELILMALIAELIMLPYGPPLWLPSYVKILYQLL